MLMACTISLVAGFQSSNLGSHPPNKIEGGRREFLHPGMRSNREEKVYGKNYCRTQKAHSTKKIRKIVVI